MKAAVLASIVILIIGFTIFGLVKLPNSLALVANLLISLYYGFGHVHYLRESGKSDAAHHGGRTSDRPATAERRGISFWPLFAALGITAVVFIKEAGHDGKPESISHDSSESGISGSRHIHIQVENNPGTTTLPKSDRISITDTAVKYLRTSESGSEEDSTKYLTEPVNYYDLGLKTYAEVRQIESKYNQEWGSGSVCMTAQAAQ